MSYSPQQSPQEYYSNPNSLGNYQYISLEEIIDQMLIEAMDDDSFLKNTKRSKILMHAKQGIKKLTREASKEVISIELTIGNDLLFELPQDYVDYVAIFTPDVDGRLQPININNNINTATGFVQDSNALIIFDIDGNIITSDSTNNYGKPYNKYYFDDNWMGGYFETDVSKLSRYGEVKIDERRGCILCSSNLLNKSIILQYYSDGLQWENIQGSDITIHKLIEEPLKDWIYFACIERKRNVPISEKNRALSRYKSTLHKSKKLRADINLNEISRMINTGGRML